MQNKTENTIDIITPILLPRTAKNITENNPIIIDFAFR
jgi:hypothetical protein